MKLEVSAGSSGNRLLSKTRSAFYVAINSEDPILLVLAANHLIKVNQAFHTAIGKAEMLTERSLVIT